MIRRLVAFWVVLALAGPARGADGSTRRFAIVAGASLGGSGRTPLRYAASDARDVARVLRRLGGVAFDDLVLVEEPDADRLRSALRAVAAETEKARRAGRWVELFVYYSGHSDEDGLLLGATRLPYADLRRALDEVPADVRVAILDSCASGAITRAKGGVHRPPFLLDESSRVSGHAFLTSSAADEAAQESDRLRGSFFTHALLTGLRGAADASGDGVVTLNEAYQFAFRETLAGTEASQAGPQHATYDIGLVGSGDVVMTDLRRADGILVIPEAVDGRVFVRSAGGTLVAELRKARGARIELALEEGRYEVMVAREKKVLGATITLAASDRAVLDEARMWPVTLEATAPRGPGEEPPPVALAPQSAAAPPLLAEPARVPTTWGAQLRGGGAVSMRRRSPAGAFAEAAGEMWAWDIVGLEIALGYGQMSGSTEGHYPSTANLPPGEVKDTLTIVPCTATLKLALPAGRVHPFVLGGGGAMWVRLDRLPGRGTVVGWTGERRLSQDLLTTTFHVGGGVDVELSRHARLGVDVRYGFGSAHLLQRYVLLEAIRATASLGFTF